MKIIILSIIFFIFTSCGYTPSAKFARNVMGENVSTSVFISALDPENTVIIKDAVDTAIIDVFHASLTSRATSQTHLDLNIAPPTYTPIVFDKHGFIIGYRMIINLTILRYREGVSKKYHVKGTHDFEVAPNAIVTDQERFEAIRFSSAKAIRSFIARVSAEGARANKEKSKSSSEE